MTGETSVTVTGILTGDPELRFTPGGSAIANFTIASTPGSFDAQAEEGHAGETLFLSARVRGQAAGHAAESLVKGMRVIAIGVLTFRSYVMQTGEKRTVVELDVEEVGPLLRSATTSVTATGMVLGGGPAPHLDDASGLSAREYADDARWFGLDANPGGRITTTTQGVSGG